MWNFKVRSMEHHVRFDDTVSECDSDVSWYSYISSSGKCYSRLTMCMLHFVGLVMHRGSFCWSFYAPRAILLVLLCTEGHFVGLVMHRCMALRPT